MNGLAIESRVSVLESQCKRIVADIESEKDNRAEKNSDINHSLELLDERMRDIEKTVWKGIGIIAAINGFITIALTIFLHFLTK